MTPPAHPPDEAATLRPVQETRPAQDETAPAAPANEPAPRPGRRQRLLILGGIVAALAVAVVGVHLYLTRGDQNTDDAQVDADVVPIAPRVGGAVLGVAVRDNQQVHRGDLLFEIDPADYEARVREAEGALATADAQASAADAQVQVVEAMARGGLAGWRAGVS